MYGQMWAIILSKDFTIYDTSSPNLSQKFTRCFAITYQATARPTSSQSTSVQNKERFIVYKLLYIRWIYARDSTNTIFTNLIQILLEKT